MGWRGSGGSGRAPQKDGAAPPVVGGGVMRGHAVGRRLARADLGASVLAALPVTGDGAVCVSAKWVPSPRPPVLGLSAAVT